MSRTKILLDQTRDGNGRVRRGWRITEGTKYITCVYLPCWKSERCYYFRIPKEDFTTPEQMLRDIWNGCIPLYKRGKPIF